MITPKPIRDIRLLVKAGDPAGDNRGTIAHAVLVSTGTPLCDELRKSKMEWAKTKHWVVGCETCTRSMLYSGYEPDLDFDGRYMPSIVTRLAKDKRPAPIKTPRAKRRAYWNKNRERLDALADTVTTRHTTKE